MARKFLYVIAGIIVLILAGLLVLRVWGMELARLAFVPSAEFTELAAVRPNAYEDKTMWLARPDLGPNITTTSWLPKGAVSPPIPGDAAIFYIHPTTYLNRAAWNAPLDDKDANDRAAMVTRMQATVFSGAGDIWAPRYRQATFGSFLEDSDGGQKAKEAAYRDIEAAFATFLTSVAQSRPIILAGHSQGALHLVHLIKDHVKGKPIAKRLVAAYIIGSTVSEANDLDALGLQPCKDGSDTGCLLSWQSFAEPGDLNIVLDSFDASNGLNGKPNKGTQLVCVNPLTGGKGVLAPASANMGTLKTNSDATEGELLKGLVPARCDGRGFLMIGEPVELGSFVMPGNNYHVYDFSLFWANVRADAMGRLAAFKSGS